MQVGDVFAGGFARGNAWANAFTAHERRWVAGTTPSLAIFDLKSHQPSLDGLSTTKTPGWTGMGVLQLPIAMHRV